MKVAVVQYNAGNTLSVQNALSRLGVDGTVTESPEDLEAADRVIFPGVGEASTAMAYLKERGLDRVLLDLTQPVLGICLGQQLLCAHSEENDTECLGIFSEEVKRLTGVKKVPHIGWNQLTDLKGPLFKDVAEGSYVYFVHSYAAGVGTDTIGCADYGSSFSAALQKDNFYSVQFHPEKSGGIGAKILENFLCV